MLARFGIRWEFSERVEYGQYVNGDYWVVGPVSIVNIDPPSVEYNGRIINGSMINPDPTLGSFQGFDEGMGFIDYSPALNVARPGGVALSATNTLDLVPGDSLISTRSVDASGSRPQVEDAAVLTVVALPPPPRAFRPSYVDTSATSKFSYDNLNTRLLASLTPVASTPSLASVEDDFERPWIDFIPGWTARFIHPANNMPDYGREMAAEVGVAALMLNLDYSIEEKRTLLTRFVQLGIDLWGIVERGGGWSPDGGHASGRKWPIVFAGMMLGNSDMANVGPGDGSGAAAFGEDGQTFYVDADTVAATNSGSWNPDSRTPDSQPYANPAMIGMPEWGIRHSTNPFADDASWNAYYRTCCTATAWPGFVLAAHIMGATDEWNHPPLFDYMDRWMAIMNGDPDPDGYAAVNGQPSTPQGLRSWTAFPAEMWDTYRALY